MSEARQTAAMRGSRSPDNQDITMSETVQAAIERLIQSRDRARETAKRGDIFDPNPQIAAMAIEASNYANAIDTVLAALTEARREVSELREVLNAVMGEVRLGRIAKYYGDLYRLIDKALGRRAAALLQRGEQPGGGEEWTREVAAPSIDPKGPTITHAQLCRLSQTFNRADGTYDGDGFAINEWLKHRIALSAEVAALSDGEA